jgi:hypothetical protein
MFSAIKSLLGNITVVEKGDLIYIDGLPARVIMHDIFKIWATSKIAAHMFTSVRSHSLVFNKFFAPDVAYTLSVVAARKEGTYHFRALNRVIELLYTETWLRTTFEQIRPRLNIAALKNLNVTLMPHQDEFLKTYEANTQRYQLNGYLLAAAPGSGKTITGLALGAVLEADVVVCIVPKNSVVDVWQKTISSLYKKPVSYWVSTMPEALRPGCTHYVFHYEQLGRAVEFFKQYRFTNPVVLLDECHNLNDLNSDRTKLFVQLCQVLQSKNVVWASGTPLKAIGNEAMPLLMTTDRYFTEDAQNRFKSIFGKNASRAVDILRNRLGLMTFKIDKQTVVGNKVTTREIKVEIPNGHEYTLEAVRTKMRDFITERMAYYEKNMTAFVNQYMEALRHHSSTLKTPQQHAAFQQYENYIAQIRRGYDPATMKDMVIYCNHYELKVIVPSLPKSRVEEFKNARSVVKYYQLKVQGEALGRILGKQRTQCHVDMVPYVDLETIVDTSLKKTLIFTSYVEVVNAIAEKMSAKGYQPLRVFGETNKDLPAIVKEYEKNPDANPLAATFKSLSTAVPLVMANTVVMMNSPFREYERNQAISRVDRIGQTEEVFVVNVFLDTGAEPNISTRSNDILEWSRQMVDSIMGTNSAGEVIALESHEEWPALRGLNLGRPAWTNWY